MSSSKKAYIRYLTIDRCLRNSQLRYSSKELQKACESALSDEMCEEVSISLRQIQIDLQYLQRLNGYAAPIEEYKLPPEKRTTYYRYSDPEFTILKQPLKPEDRDALNEALQSLLSYQGRPELEWIHELIGRIQPGSKLSPQSKAIVYDENPEAIGLIHIQPIFEAIRKKIPLKITYRPFDKPEIIHFISPYLLKEYNNRWYVLCRSNHFDPLTCLALDRIIQVEENPLKPYQNYPEEEDPNFFFFDFIGVTWEKIPVETIILQVRKTRLSYVLTKPIHHTQRHKKNSDDPEWDEISLRLIPNKEFYSQMLFFGDDLRILQPVSVRKKMKEIVLGMYSHYHEKD